jgi:hypothetical protein
LHWPSALIGSEFRAANAVDTAAEAAILRVHVPLAIAVLALTAVQIGW